jgi:hypothetical protein
MFFSFFIVNIAHAAGVIEDAPHISTVLLNALQFLLSIFGYIAIISLVVSGIIYLTSGGDEEKVKLAKKSTVYSVVGIVVVLGMMVVIKFLTKSLA